MVEIAARGIRPEVMEALHTASAPTIVYDDHGIRQEFALLRRHMEEAFGERHPVRLLFSVKANAFPDLLSSCVAQGVGGSVASMPEFATARAAGMHPIHATSPGFTASDVAVLLAAEAELDVDNVEQLAVLPRGSEVGLRLQVPDDDRREGVSRFGIDPADPKLHELLSEGRQVVRLHAHTRDIGTMAQMEGFALLLVRAAQQFPELRTINVGGGLTRLYKDPERSADSWRAFARVMSELPPGMTVIAEPGAQVVMRHGYLATNVVSSLPRADGRRLVTLDTSKWRLVAWTDLELFSPLPRPGDVFLTDLVGPTCYERDVWLSEVAMPALSTGDRVVIGGLGAYVASMMRRMHGLPDPREVLV
jgi:diaminopimelate decarboxylase